MIDSVPAVFSSALGVLPAAGAHGLHAVPPPQHGALGPLQQTAPVVPEGQRRHLQRGRERVSEPWGTGDECEPAGVS